MNKETKNSEVNVKATSEIVYVDTVTRAETEMLEEYDFSRGVRGKYAARYRQGTNLVLLAHDVVEAFPDSEAVNEALRTLIKLAWRSVNTKTGNTAAA